jgi:hypothetical protein
MLSEEGGGVVQGCGLVTTTHQRIVVFLVVTLLVIGAWRKTQTHVSSYSPWFCGCSSPFAAAAAAAATTTTTATTAQLFILETLFSNLRSHLVKSNLINFYNIFCVDYLFVPILPVYEIYQ